MKCVSNQILFKGQPYNYRKIDDYVSRSAQPMAVDFQWLKKQGVTDVINFRTMRSSGLDFDEKTVVENNGMKYHNIPSYTRSPKEKNIEQFLNIVENAKENNGKVHIHCMAGSDRTGMYAWIYKQINNIGTMLANKQEMLQMGHHDKLFPNLIGWIENYLKNFRRIV